MTFIDAALLIRRRLQSVARPPAWLFVGCLLASLSLSSRASAQAGPAGPYTTPGGRLTLAGQASISTGSDDEGYFNYSTYDYTLLRALRVDANGEFRVTDRLALLGDVRVLASTDEAHWLVRPYAVFARLTPWTGRAIDVQAGLVPPVFGTFSRRAYETDNPLIGYPLTYQYLTSLRADAVPASNEDLLQMRGRGWRASYPLGNATPSEGLPLADGVRYQTGVEVHAGSLQPLEGAVAWTNGSLSAPQYERGTLGGQISGRVAARPIAGLVVGFSASRGLFLTQALRDGVAAGSAGDQRALGFDVEYSRARWILRTEGVYSRWRLPGLGASTADTPLSAFGIDVEGRYRIRPGLYLAARLDHLGFSKILDGPVLTPWESPVRRLEIGAGYSFWRNVLLKAAWQHNHRAPGGYVAPGRETYDTLGLGSVQLVVWF